MIFNLFFFFWDLTGARSENYEFGTSYILVYFVHAKNYVYQTWSSVKNT